MANVNNDRNKKIRKFLSIIIIALIIVFYLYDFNKEDEIINLPVSEGVEQQTQQNMHAEGELILTMIDVGQADCFLLMQSGKTALVDCGTRSTGKVAVEYLKSIGITRLDYVFGTHPHDDHMGGMYDIITNFEIGKIIIPKVVDNITTNWYLKLMQEITSGDYVVEEPKLGNIYNLGDATMKVIGPLSPANGNKNNYSTVLKVSFGEMDVIMTGDAEKKVEQEIIASGENIDAEILKVGHHGSDTSSMDEFIDAISPDYGLISCGLGNKYNHPIKSTMEKLKKRGIIVYRTDESGTVVATITSDNVTFDSEPGDYLSGPELEERESIK